MPEQRLIEVLQERGLKGGGMRDALQTGKIAVWGVPTADSGRLVDPSAVTITPTAPRITVGRDLAILYRDDHLAVVWKPAGMLSVPAPRAGGHQNLVGLVGRILGGAHVVHRLDEDTSGLLVVARTGAAQEALKDAFERHAIERRYLALVVGRFAEAEITRHTWFVRDRGDGLRGSVPPGMAVPPDAKEAITHFHRTETLRQVASVVEARLETGRTHQVRIHLAEAGHAVLGDQLYGGSKAVRLSSRLALHASVLGFQHPFLNRPMRFFAPLADDLERLRRRLAGQTAR